jgi:hypothetical protein
VPEILGLEGDLREPVRDPTRLGALVELLLGAPSVAPPIGVGPWLKVLHGVVRDRLTSMERPAHDADARRLSGLIARRAAQAATARDGDLLAALDTALARLLAGVRAGGIDLLRETLAMRRPRRPVETWVRAQGDPPGPANVTLDAAIFGDGTVSALTSRPTA